MTDVSSSQKRSLVVTYTKEKHTYYTTLNPKLAASASAASASASASASDANDTISAPILAAAAASAASDGGEEGNRESSGLTVWPASHLLSQYLAYSIIASPPSEAVKRFSVMCIDPKNPNPPPVKRAGGGGGPRFPPLGSRVLELGCGAGLCGIVAALALSRKAREANAELCKAAAVLDFDKIDLDDLSSDTDSDAGGGSAGGDGLDDDSLGAAGGGGGKKLGGDDDDEAIVVCTDGDPEAVDLCRENVTRDLFLAEEYENSFIVHEEDEDDGLIDDDTAAAIAAAAGEPGAAVAPAGQRQQSAHPLPSQLDTSRKVAFDVDNDSDAAAEGFGAGAEGHVRVLARTLRWGDHRAARDLMREATAATSNLFSATDLDEDFRSSILVAAPRAPSDERFDTVMASDVVRPSTSDEDLRQLFKTVNQCLKPGGTFLLSFVARGGPRTSLGLLRAASGAGFKVDCIPEDEFVPRDSKGQSMLPDDASDAKLLVMRRDEDAADFNGLLGSDSCRIFPGLKSRAEKEGN